jgi:hypothetical protein
MSDGPQPDDVLFSDVPTRTMADILTWTLEPLPLALRCRERGTIGLRRGLAPKENSEVPSEAMFTLTERRETLSFF